MLDMIHVTARWIIGCLSSLQGYEGSLIKLTSKQVSFHHYCFLMFAEMAKKTDFSMWFVQVLIMNVLMFSLTYRLFLLYKNILVKFDKHKMSIMYV